MRGEVQRLIRRYCGDTADSVPLGDTDTDGPRGSGDRHSKHRSFDKVDGRCVARSLDKVDSTYVVPVVCASSSLSFQDDIVGGGANDEQPRLPTLQSWPGLAKIMEVRVETCWPSLDHVLVGGYLPTQTNVQSVLNRRLTILS